VEQELDRVGALFVAEQDRRLAVGELERVRPRGILLSGAVKVADRGAVLATVDPGVVSANIDAIILALPETAGSVLYGMVDVLAATGTLWRELVGEGSGHRLIHPRIVAPSAGPFGCGNGIPVDPEVCLQNAGWPELLVLPELWLAPTDDMGDRYAEVKVWIRQCYQSGSTIYTACSGSILLAALSHEAEQCPPIQLARRCHRQ